MEIHWLTALFRYSKQSYIEKVIQKSDGKLVVIDFFATWCGTSSSSSSFLKAPTDDVSTGPCRAIAPQIEKFDKEYTDVDFYKIDVDETPDVSGELGVRAMPTFVFFKNGEKVAEVVGANPSAVKAAIIANK